MTDKVVVTQADRDAAAECIAVWGDVGAMVEAHKVRQGECDDHGLVQAFARRTAAQPEREAVLDAEKYADMGVEEKANAMADDCVGDPWELIGFFREKLRQARCEADDARSAAISLAKERAALTTPTPAVSRDEIVELAEVVAALPCETKGAEDLEPGCCRTCRARAILSRIRGEG